MSEHPSELDRVIRDVEAFVIAYILVIIIARVVRIVARVVYRASMQISAYIRDRYAAHNARP